MKFNTMAIIAAVSLLTLVSAVATAQIYGYRSGAPVSGEFTAKMQQEMNEVFDLQQKYQSGQITQDQYQQGMQQHWQEMQEIHDQYGVQGCPMHGSSIQANNPAVGMMTWR